MTFQQNLVTAMIGVALVTVTPGFSSSLPTTPGAPTQMVITVLPPPAANLEAAELMVQQGNTRLPVARL